MRFTFAYGLACHDLSPANTVNIPADIPVGEPAKLAALAARNLAADRIAATLWPVFDRRRATAPLSRELEGLLTADFAILQKLRVMVDTKWTAEDYVAYYCDDSMFDSIGIMPRGGVLTHHRAHLGASFGRFVQGTFDDAALDNLDAAFMQEVAGTPTPLLVSWILMSLKHMFQRPRPYQYAFDNDETDFKHMLSQLAHSPALPSGHAFDGAFWAILGAEVIEQLDGWKGYKSKLPAWAAAFGDRRNYAGLHYPSDNWATWIAVATIIETLFRDDVALRAKQNLLENIKASSCFVLAKDLPVFDRAKAQLTSLIGSLD